MPVPANGGAGRGSMIAAPMVGGGRLVGAIGLRVRASRPVGRGEILLVGAFAGRIAEIVTAGGTGGDDRLRRAVERFRASWTTAIAA